MGTFSISGIGVVRFDSNLSFLLKTNYTSQQLLTSKYRTAPKNNSSKKMSSTSTTVTTSLFAFISVSLLLNAIFVSLSASAIRIQTHKFKKSLDEPLFMQGEFVPYTDELPGVAANKRYISPLERSQLYAMEEAQFGEKRAPPSAVNSEFFYDV